MLIAACDGDGAQQQQQQPTVQTTAEPVPDQDGGDEGGTGGELPPLGDGQGGAGLIEIGAFESPVYITQPPGEQDDLYVVEQSGRVARLAGKEQETYLDVSAQITTGGERGLLSVAFAPDFESSGLLYVNYTDRAGDTRVVEFRDQGGTVDSESAREVLTIDQPFENHNGGLLKFGPDDLLYIGTGDGGSAADPQRNAQNLASLLGKILRIDPRATDGAPYAVPEDNPFAGQPGAAPEVYSYGLRNPWRFSFDRLTGDLGIGDVGQNAQEELDLVARGEGSGANFGWSAFEGTDRFNADQEALDAVPPVLTYPLGNGNCAVTGGYVVRDQSLPSLFGRYLYADFCVGELRSFPSAPGRPATDDVALGVQVLALSSFGEDNRGQIYVTSLEGQVFRLISQ